MQSDVELFEAIVDRFRDRMVEAGQRMRAARSPREFYETEKTVHELARELADAYTSQVLSHVVADAERIQEASDGVRATAGGQGIVMRPQGRRRTPVRLLGGTTVHLRTTYMSTQPRGAGVRESRGKAGTGVFPVLDELGICNKATPALRLRVAHSVCEANSVADARELMRQSGLKLTHRVALRLTYATTELALQARKRAVKATRTGNAQGEFAGRQVVVCVDGGRVRVRTALRGRPPKGGRRKFRRDWREPKVLTLYVLGEDGRRDKKVRSVIDGTLGDADEVFLLLLYHLRRVGAHKAASVTLLGDGAKWIWVRAKQLAKDLGLAADTPFTEIVDYFHVVERLTEFARSRVGWSDKREKRWVLEQKKRLKRGWIERIVTSIEPHLTRAERKKGTEVDYWVRNMERMRFARYRKQGLPNGSGAVESAVRRVINLRLKGASIVWKEEHAEGIVHLRAHSKSGRWDELVQTVLENSRWTPKARQKLRVA